jgi:hypothetical protein
VEKYGRVGQATDKNMGGLLRLQTYTCNSKVHPRTGHEGPEGE